MSSHAPRKRRGSAPTYFTNGFSGARAGRMVVRSLSTTNSTRSPCFSPSRLRISRGTVIWPLLLMVLERVIFILFFTVRIAQFACGNRAEICLGAPECLVPLDRGIPAECPLASFRWQVLHIVRRDAKTPNAGFAASLPWFYSDDVRVRHALALYAKTGPTRSETRL